MDNNFQPVSRVEQYLFNAATGAGTIPQQTINRKEYLLKGIIERLDALGGITYEEVI